MDDGGGTTLDQTQYTQLQAYRRALRTGRRMSIFQPPSIVRLRHPGWPDIFDHALAMT